METNCWENKKRLSYAVSLIHYGTYQYLRNSISLSEQVAYIVGIKTATFVQIFLSVTSTCSHLCYGPLCFLVIWV